MEKTEIKNGSEIYGTVRELLRLFGEEMRAAKDELAELVVIETEAKFTARSGSCCVCSVRIPFKQWNLRIHRTEIRISAIIT